MVIEPEGAREQGVIASWSGMGMGRIRADNGDSIPLFYWSVLEGFRHLTVGQRVEFSRARFVLNRTVATLVVPVRTDAGAN